jgi:putative drug exporter of the RND superfamily
MSAVARWCVAHRLIVVLLWLALIAGLSAGVKVAGSHFSNGSTVSNTESGKALSLLEKAEPAAAGTSGTVVWDTSHGTVRAAAVEQRMERALAQISSAPGVTAVVSPYGRLGAGQISRDGHTAYATVVYGAVASGNSVPKGEVQRVQDIAAAIRGSGLDVQLGGQAFAPSVGASGTEAIGILAALVILLLMFRSLWAAALPVLIGIAGVGTGTLGVVLLSHKIALPDTTPTMGALIGLGVGIDYALFIVNRHRRELMAGRSTAGAAAKAQGTSGRAVVFAGVTVVVALLGMRLLGMSILSSMALGAALTVAVTVLAAITLLPAILGLLGVRVLSRRQRRELAQQSGRHAKAGWSVPTGKRSLAGAGEPTGLWARWAGVVQARPRILGLVAVVVMAALAVPGLTIRLGTADASNNAHSSSSYKAYEMLAEGFGPGFNGPLLLVAQAHGPQDQARLAVLARDLTTVPDVASVQAAPLRPGSDIGVVTVVPASSPESGQTSDLITTLRHDVIPRAEQGSGLKVYVGGVTASNDDTASALLSKIPLFLAVVIGLGFVLLAAAFRSLLIPAIAAAMNVLTMGAAFGAIVLVFQKGHGAALLHAGSAGPIEPIVPALITGIVFGLSMDYQVFLVSRMHEEWSRTHDSHQAVRAGQGYTGQVIAVAAAIMCAVFAAFTLGGQRIIAELGLGLAVAVALDAFLLRMVAVPAIMHLGGRTTWWMPAWLDRILPRLSVEGSTSVAAGGIASGASARGEEPEPGQPAPDVPARR